MDALNERDRQRFDALLDALADVFDGEGAPGGAEAARVLRDGKRRPFRRWDRRTDLGDRIRAALEHPQADPLAAVIRDAFDLIPWHFAGLEDGRIRPEIARVMATTYLVGPTGVIEDDAVWVGLFYQSPELDYPMRTHAAEETFYVVSGSAEWRVGEDPPAPKPPGAYVRHPSNAPHASITKAEPTLAAWRWTGNIDFKTYELQGWAQS